MFLLSLNYLKGEEYKNKLESFASFWNESIPEIIENRDKDIQEFKDDDNIAFKWQHLVDQEIRMWINLGCHSHSVIDVENEKYEVGQVDIEDFNYIVGRRGFTPRMTSFLIKILKHVGIGNNL